MKVILRVEKGIAPIQNFAISRNTLVGRSNSCDLRIESDDVSRRHCFLLVTDNGVWVRDLSSSNGTSIDGNIVETGQDCMLFPGSHVEIGPVEFSVHFQLDKEPEMARVGSQFSASVDNQLSDNDATVLMHAPSNFHSTDEAVEPSPISAGIENEASSSVSAPSDRFSGSEFENDRAGLETDDDSGRLKSLFSQLVGWTKTRS